MEKTSIYSQGGYIMKAFITSLKSWFIIILSGVLIILFFFACSSPPDGKTTTTTTTTSGGNGGDGDDDDEDDKDLACSLPKCSGSKCCNKGSKSQKEKCADWCGDSGYLGLSGSAEELCLTLDRGFVDDSLVELFSDNVLGEPDEESLKDIKKEDVGIICAAVRELDPDLLGDLIDKYSNNEAEIFLGWVSETKGSVDIFEKTKKDEDGINMVKTLLDQLDSDSDDQGVVDGLGEPIDFDDNDDKNILERALDSNEDLVQFIHKKVLQDKDEGICGEDQKDKNWPKPVAGDAAANPPAGYGTSGDTDAHFENANDNRQRACVLAIYCKALSGATNNDVRKDLADAVSDSRMKSFIDKDIDDGGLGLTERDGEKWPATVCTRLNRLWQNNDASGAVDLGLNASL